MDIEQKLFKKIKKSTKKCTLQTVKSENPLYFHLKPTDKQIYVQSRLIQLKPRFLEFLKIAEFSPINHRSLKSFYTFGMISTANGSKIETDSSVYIFNTIDDSNIPVQLDFSGLDSYSIFNGQIVAIKGTNSRGDSILVEKIYNSPSLVEYKGDKNDINFIVSKGPYSLEILNNIFKNEADPYILLGPFNKDNKDSYNSNIKDNNNSNNKDSYDSNSNNIKDNNNSNVNSNSNNKDSYNSNSNNKDNNNISDYFKSFSDFIDSLNFILSKNPLIRIAIVPSLEDSCSVQIFPQPKINLENDRIISLDNPSYLLINDHLVLISNFDSFIDLSYEEYFRYNNNNDFNNISSSDDNILQKDKIQRIAHHIVFQQSHCPVLNPKSPVSFGKWLGFNFSPDLYVISSKMKSFCKEIGTVTLFNIGGLNESTYKIVSDGNNKNTSYTTTKLN